MDNMDKRRVWLDDTTQRFLFCPRFRSLLGQTNENHAGVGTEGDCFRL
jgi:hypothetical protein